MYFVSDQECGNPCRVLIRCHLCAERICFDKKMSAEAGMLRQTFALSFKQAALQDRL